MKKSLKGYRQPLVRRLNVVSFSFFLAALLVGCLQLTSPKNFGPGYEMVAVARNLAMYGAFANPYFALPTGPTAANPPRTQCSSGFYSRSLSTSKLFSLLLSLPAYWQTQ